MTRTLALSSLLVLGAIGMYAPVAKAEGVLGIASDYNVFVFGDMNQSSDSEGRVAVGGNATFTNYGIGDRLANSGGSDTRLIVGGNLNYNGGQVFGGNAIVGGQVQSNVNFNCGGCTVQSGSPIDFAAAKQQYTSISQNLAALQATGNAVHQWGGLLLNGTGAGTELFTIDGSLFNQSSYVDFKGMNSNSTIVLNILGDSVKLNNMGLNLNGVDKTKVLFNFVNATQIQSSGFSFAGSVLAPTANLNFNNGNLEGTLIAQSVSGSGEFHNYRYAGSLPVSVTATPAPAQPKPVEPISQPLQPTTTVSEPIAEKPVLVSEPSPQPVVKPVQPVVQPAQPSPIKSVPEPGAMVGLLGIAILSQRRKLRAMIKAK